jgi:hypothetical protein
MCSAEKEVNGLSVSLSLQQCSGICEGIAELSAYSMHYLKN